MIARKKIIRATNSIKKRIIQKKISPFYLCHPTSNHFDRKSEYKQNIKSNIESGKAQNTIGR